VKRIAAAGGAPSTVFAIPEGLMGVQIDPIAERVLVRNGERAHVLTLAGDSVATIAWPRGLRTVAYLGFPLTARRSSLRSMRLGRRSTSVPLDGGPIRALTDSSGYPWPDYWVRRPHLRSAATALAAWTPYSPSTERRALPHSTFERRTTACR
jgi:hypothetical protein